MNFDIKSVRQLFQIKQRKKETLEQIMKLVQDVKFFKEKREIFDQTLYFQMLKKLQLQELSKGEVLFHYGITVLQQGSNNVEQFYVILQGQVAILCPKSKMISQKQILDEYQNEVASSPKSSNDSLREIIMQQAYANFLGMRADLKQFDQDSLIDEYNHNPNDFKIDFWLENLVKRRFPSMKIVNMCYAGDQFGEIALIGHVRRTATVLGVVDCIMLTLCNSDFQTILHQYHQQVRNEKIQLLRNFSLFRPLSDNKLKNMIEHIIVQKQSIFSIIYYENTAPEYIYFIKSGEVELLKIVSKTKQVSISLLQVGCVFGHQEIKNQTLRQYRAISKSCQCELYLIPVSIVLQFDQQQADNQTEKEFHQQRLSRLLSERVQTKKKKQTLSPQSIEQQYKGDKDYETFINYAYATKRVLSPKHKKLMSEPFVPFFIIPNKVRQHTSLSKILNYDSKQIDQRSNSKYQGASPVNIHRHLFSPKITKRHLDTFMPFKKFVND